uniref:NADH-ubiquinone oxidoreductase chain 4L n=1 Tax=Mecysmoderes ater TaxID=3158840 RepID=A0AAU7GHC7_9CUCU
MMMVYYLTFFTMFLSGLLAYILKYRHFLLMLLSLEFMVLSIYMFMFMYLAIFGMEGFFVMFFLAMSVCEGALGLSLLVMIIRSHGSDFLMMYDNLW